MTSDKRTETNKNSVNSMSETNIPNSDISYPDLFLQCMQALLKTEYSDFLESLKQKPCRALRLNPLKTSKELFCSQAPFSLRPVPWEEYGFYYEEGGDEDAPGKHPFQDAGLYYIQEPSAMSPVPFLEVKPGERILDLCAAPGGKSTQIGCAMAQEGLLVSNEIHPARAKILSSNIERLGLANCLVLNETPEKLAARFPEFFEKILVDAPCSGEGMFRKNKEAVSEWSPENVRLCAARQDSVLSEAAKMLRPGGRLVYSTCTFAPEENEGTICRFLTTHPDFFLEKTVRPNGFMTGWKDWAYISYSDMSNCDMLCKNRSCSDIFVNDISNVSNALSNTNSTLSNFDSTLSSTDISSFNADTDFPLEYTHRLFPHKVKGEGHFIAVLGKKGEGVGLRDAAVQTKNLQRNEDKYGKTEKLPREVSAFFNETLSEEGLQLFSHMFQRRKTLTFGEQLYLAPENLPELKGLKTLRPGLHLGTFKKNRFEPSHGLALFLTPAMVQRSFSFSQDSLEIRDFLAGQALSVDSAALHSDKEDSNKKGWSLVCVEGYSLGWGKLSGQILKNHYPKGLRTSHFL